MTEEEFNEALKALQAAPTLQWPPPPDPNEPQLGSKQKPFRILFPPEPPMAETTPMQALIQVFDVQALNEFVYAMSPPMFAPRASGWNRVRNAYLRKHKTCAACGGMSQPEVHHILPYHLFPEKELDPTNLMTLCRHPARLCHFIFGHLNDWAAWNPGVREYAANHLKLIQHRKYGA